MAELPQIVDRNHRVWRTLRALDEQGILGLDHLRLWRGLNSLVRRVGDPLSASYSLFLMATAHANMAVVCLRKLLDTTKNTVSVPYLLTLVDRHLGTILGEMRNRPPAQRMTKADLQHLLGSHEERLAEIKNGAAPIIKTVNNSVVHVARDHVNDPAKMAMQLEAWRVSADTLAGCFHDLGEIVNQWDELWRLGRMPWEQSSHDDFQGIRVALMHAADKAHNSLLPG